MYRNFKMVYYKKIMAIAEMNDYLLVNNIVLRNRELVVCNIDHILFGKKYIYVIKDRYYRGAISGNIKDDVWLFFNTRDEKTEISNPMKRNEVRVEKLCALTNIDKKMIVSIVVVNNDCMIKDVKSLQSPRSYICSIKGLRRVIRKIEKSKVADIDQKSLDYAVNDIYRLYGAGRDE